MTYTEAMETERLPVVPAGSDHLRRRPRLAAAVAEAIIEANWFNGQDRALRYLAAIGEAEQIRLWADDIEANMPECTHARQSRACNQQSDCTSHGWPLWFCRRLARLWRRVARLCA